MNEMPAGDKNPDMCLLWTWSRHVTVFVCVGAVGVWGARVTSKDYPSINNQMIGCVGNLSPKVKPILGVG